MGGDFTTFPRGREDVGEKLNAERRLHAEISRILIIKSVYIILTIKSIFSVMLTASFRHNLGMFSMIEKREINRAFRTIKPSNHCFERETYLAF